MYVLDSSAIIEIFEEYPHMQKILDILGDESFVTTSISMHEVFAGAHSQKDRFIVSGLFSQAHILEHDAKAARIGATIEQELTHAGKMINRTDILIAGICKAHNAELVTLDKDFAKIKDIKVH